MVPTNSISVFLKHNDSELRRMVFDTCKNLNCLDQVEDMTQDLYYKFLTTNILQSYNRHFCSGGKFTSSRLSTYLYPIIKNHVLSAHKSKEERFFSGLPLSPLANKAKKMEEIIEACSIRNNTFGVNYKDTLNYNMSTDAEGKAGIDFEDFQEKFGKSLENKKYATRKKADASQGCSLLELLRYIYKGYSNKEIARAYKVSNMTITHMKHHLAEAMMKFGYDCH